jgi:hypothetical protein
MMLSLMTAFPVVVQAAPDGYSINSDSLPATEDSLYRIDLATGAETRLGLIRTNTEETKIDVEGLAFAPDGTLYGVDDQSLTLFPINIDNGRVLDQQDVNLGGLPIGGANDFGLTFACDGNLYLTSVTTRSLYRVSLDGTATRIGAPGSLGANISALAAFGISPVQLFGLGNGGLNGDSSDVGRLYSINPADGAATIIGQLGSGAAKYDEAGLAFDNADQLWAITDRNAVLPSPLPSQILRIDKNTGLATLVAQTTEFGFESLAITVPRGCGTGGGETARFTVQKRFVDGNDITPVTLNISCNTGLPLQQSRTVQPNQGALGEFEVEFVVSDFDDGELSCTITETPPAGYTPSYTCLGESDCAAAQSPNACVFTSVATGSENLCQVQNAPSAVPFTVVKEWLFEAEELGSANVSRIELECENVFDGDGLRDGDDMSWFWEVEGDQSLVAMISPAFDGSTRCQAAESPLFNAVEAQNGCTPWIPVAIGEEPKSCTIVNTVFLEGVPTLSDYGLFLFAVLMLITGMVAMRRV